MSIQGPLKELGIHDVFQLLDLSRKTGVLKVTSVLRQNEGTIWFENGSVVAAQIRSNPHRLGELLLRAGRIGEADLVRAARMQREGDARRLGEILVDIGALSARQLERLVRTQVEEVVFSLLGWSEGYFVFEEGLGEVPRETNVKIRTEALLMEGARRIDEWERIRARIPHLGFVPSLAPAQGPEAGSLTLTPFEWRVLTACDGVFDVRDMSRGLAASEFDVARTLFGLAAAGVIHLRDPATPPQSVSGSPPDVRALIHQAEEHLRRGDAPAAQRLAERVMAAFPDDPRGPLLLAECCLAERRTGDAEKALQEVIRLDSENARGLRLLGVAHMEQGRLEEALRAWERWLGLPQRSSEEDRHLATLSRTVEAVRMVTEGVKVLR